MRNVFVDLGANKGNISLDYAISNPNSEIFCVEPNSALISDILAKSAQAHRLFVIMWAAAWTYDGSVKLFQSGAHEASTVVEEKIEPNHWPQIDYNNSSEVPCFDFSAWLLRSFTLNDQVTLKMDVEGAEYDLLERMIADRSILLIRRLICEWYFDRYPSISIERHNAVRTSVAAHTSLEDWH